MIDYSYDAGKVWTDNASVADVLVEYIAGNIDCTGNETCLTDCPGECNPTCSSGPAGVSCSSNKQSNL